MRAKKYKIYINDIYTETFYTATLDEYNKDEGDYKEIDYIDIDVDKEYFDYLNYRNSKLFFNGDRNKSDTYNYYIGYLLDYFLNSDNRDLNKNNTIIKLASRKKLSWEQAKHLAEKYKNAIENLK